MACLSSQEFLVQVLVLGSLLVAGVNSGCSQCAGACTREKVDLVFVIDGSGSTCQGRPSYNCPEWTNVLEFLSRSVDFLDIRSDGDRVALVQFGNEATVHFSLTEHTSHNALKAAILRTVIKDENTNTSGGLKAARTQVLTTADDRPEAANIVLVITDGKSTRDADRTLPEARLLEAAGAHTFVIGVTPQIDYAEVQGISSYPQRENVTYWFLPNFDAFDSFRVLQQVFDTFCRTADFSTLPTVAPRCPGVETDAGCYVVVETPRAWKTAETECQNMGVNLGRPGLGHLASVLDTKHNDLLVAQIKSIVSAKPSYADQDALRKFWLGGYEESLIHGGENNPKWRWVAENSLVRYQGCFEDSQTFQEFAYVTPMPSLTPTKCIEKCFAEGFKVAALNGGTSCGCGNTWGRYAATEGCSTYCPGDVTERCGGTNLNAVYLTDGSYVKWHYDQPNNLYQYQPCGKITKRTPGGWGMDDTLCYERLNHICDIPVSFCVNPPPSYYTVNGHCIYIENLQSSSWFDARMDCKARFGDLLTIDSLNTMNALSEKLGELFASAPYWIGLVGRQWKWQDGAEFIYSSWVNDEPNSLATNCLIMESNLQNLYAWNEENCDTNLPYVCYIDMVSSSTTPAVSIASNATTTTTIPTTSTKANTTTASQTPDGGGPDLGASTNNTGGGLSTFWIVVIVFIVLLVLLVLGILLYCFCYKKDTEKITPAVHASDDVYINQGFYVPTYQEPEKTKIPYTIMRQESVPKPDDGASSSTSYDIPLAAPVSSKITTTTESRYEPHGMYKIKTRIMGGNTTPTPSLTVLRANDLKAEGSSSVRRSHTNRTETDSMKSSLKDAERRSHTSRTDTDSLKEAERRERKEKRREEKREERKEEKRLRRKEEKEREKRMQVVGFISPTVEVKKHFGTTSTFAGESYSFDV